MIERPAVDEIGSAARRLAGVVVHTPLIPFVGDEGILLKPEILQVVTSFKIRGILNAVSLLPPEQRACGLSTVSAGNTAQALAWAGRHFGVPARSLMPDTAPQAKIEAVRRLGGEPVLVPAAELFQFLERRGWEDQPFAFVHPWIDRNVMIGHGTIGLEIAADLPDVETVFVPVGGGGLIAGVACALRALAPRARTIAVEPAGCPSLHESLRLGRPARVECRTFCDGVAVPFVTEELFPLLREVVDDAVLVTDDAARAVIRELALRQRLIVEGSAALALAAALAMPASDRGRCVCLLTGGSIDSAELLRILAPSA